MSHLTEENRSKTLISIDEENGWQREASHQKMYFKNAARVYSICRKHSILDVLNFAVVMKKVIGSRLSDVRNWLPYV